jgi:hypothetical protein
MISTHDSSTIVLPVTQTGAAFNAFLTPLLRILIPCLFAALDNLLDGLSGFSKGDEPPEIDAVGIRRSVDGFLSFAPIGAFPVADWFIALVDYKSYDTLAQSISRRLVCVGRELFGREMFYRRAIDNSDVYITNRGAIYEHLENFAWRINNDHYTSQIAIPTMIVISSALFPGDDVGRR